MAGCFDCRGERRGQWYVRRLAPLIGRPLPRESAPRKGDAQRCRWMEGKRVPPLPVGMTVWGRGAVLFSEAFRGMAHLE